MQQAVSKSVLDRLVIVLMGVVMILGLTHCAQQSDWDDMQYSRASSGSGSCSDDVSNCAISGHHR